jgi:hypothetical protein
MLRLLLNFWLTPFMMMFAAGASVLDSAGVGTGGGDAGSGAGSDDSGADSGSSGDDASLGDDDGAGDGSDNSGADDDLAQAGTEGDAGANDRSNQSLDTKGFNPEDKKLLTLAQKAGPKEAQRVRQLLFAEKRLNKIVPGGVKAVEKLVRSVEDFGGVEGVQQLQADLASHTEGDELFSRADPRWVESGFETNPESSLKLFAHTLDYVSEKHPEHYNHLMAKVIKNDLDSALPVREIHALLAGLKDSPEAQKLAGQLAAYYNERNKLAGKVPEKKIDAQTKALTDRETKVHEQEMGLRYDKVNAVIFPAMKNSVTKTLQSEAKLNGLDLNKLSTEYPGEWRSMLNEIHQEIMAAVRKDKSFTNKYSSLVSAGELKRASAAVNAKHDAVIPAIARSVMKGYGVFRGKKAAPGNRNANAADKGNAGAANNANTGWNRVSAKPQNSLIDWQKTSQSMQLDGKYILKDGKRVVVQY